MSTAQQPTGIRKRFAVPPVKVACLSCRASRIRCDGKNPCSGCENRNRECLYVQSRRGGARVSQRKQQERKPHEYVKILQDCFQETVPTMIKPGAGLMSLDESLLFDDTDSLSDDVFAVTTTPTTIEQEEIHTPRTGLVRRYQSNSEMLATQDLESRSTFLTEQIRLNAYYIWIHPFFPILPPPIGTRTHDNPLLHNSSTSNDNFEPASPAALAISAVLALIPLSEDDEPYHEHSLKVRREAAHAFAQAAIRRIEDDSDLPDSTISPAQALSNIQPQISRPPFHPQVPVELEAVVALSVLSVYEYAQRGNLKKMRDRANQALVMAMGMKLHNRFREHGGFAEAITRVWWMTYICACQASIVSSIAPVISLLDLQCTTALPTSPIPEAWPMFIRSQQTILLSTQFVTDLSHAMNGRTSWSNIQQRMQILHETIEPLLAQLDSGSNITPPTTNNDDVETVVAYSLRQMSKIKLNSARIKLHRYSAFSDIPVFSEKHCDLEKFSPPLTTSSPPSLSLQASFSTTPQTPCCGCNQPLPTLAPGSSLSPSYNGSSVTTYSHPFPYSRHESSSLCLNSALQIAEAFRAMPYPSPTLNSLSTPELYTPLASASSNDTSASFFSLPAPTTRSTTTTSLQAEVSPPPRTMPSFACCAMQSAYALLMVYHRTYVLSNPRSTSGSNSSSNYSSKQGNNETAAQLLLRCEDGLKDILSALGNYSAAFEALSGMRDQIQAALDCLSLPDDNSTDAFLSEP